jgi:hypothetical protein
LSKRFINNLLQKEKNPERLFYGVGEVKNVRDSVYLTPIHFGGEEYMTVIDTGSADTWLASESLRCIHPRTKRELNQRVCRFNKPYQPTKTSMVIPDQHFNISYADGEFLYGIMVRETVTLGNITVEDQEVGIIDYAAWNGDGMSSGLTGLAFPSVTRAYEGSDPRLDSTGTKIRYNPIFTSMWKKGLVAPFFSLALNRAGERPGLLALGGIPGPPIHYEDRFATAALEYMSFKMPWERSRDDFQLYMITVDGFSMEIDRRLSMKLAKTRVLIDSGTTLTLLPPDIARALNSRWDPPARLDPITKQYVVRCRATPPKVGIVINGTVVHFDERDLVVPLALSSTSKDRDRDWAWKEWNLCLSGIQPTSSSEKDSGGLSILGGVFLKNVLAVFDVGAGELRFSNRIRRYR